jgi:RNA polymerase-binding protein DksA
VHSKELQSLKAKMLVERDRLAADLEALEESTAATPKDSSGDLSSYSSHMADQGTDAMEREKAFLFASVKRRRLEEINSALARMDAGKFGVCESCGQQIPLKRLERVPDASLCVACKEKEEKAQGTWS